MKLGYILNQNLMNKPGFAGAKHQFENQVLGMTDNQFDFITKSSRNIQNQLDTISQDLDKVLFTLPVIVAFVVAMGMIA